MKPWETFLTNLANLLKVKTVVTLVILFVFCFLALRSEELSNEFVMIATAVITYYFAKGESIKIILCEHCKELIQNIEKGGNHEKDKNMP